MARPDHLFAFAYDVSRDRDRTKLAALLEVHADRVQGSVFEARMSVAAAHAIAKAAAVYLGPDDSLRVYCVPEDGRQNSIVLGCGLLVEADDFCWLEMINKEQRAS